MRRQHGFTLMEVLVAMTLSMVVFGATLSLLEVYTRQSTRNTRLNDAQDQARIAIDRIIRQLRNISSPITSPKLIERATPYDIVFQTVDVPNGSNATGAERVRYCIPPDTTPGTPADEVLVSQVQNWSTAAPPVSPWTANPGVTIPCPDTSTVTSTKVISAVTNRYQGLTTRPAFTFNNGVAPSDLSTITSVQLDMFVNPTPTLAPAESELRSAAYLRNQLRAPLASFTSTNTGSGGVLLNGSTSWSPDGQDLSYAWSCTAPVSCPSAGALAGTSGGLVDWHPGAGTYTVSLTVTDTSGLAANSSQSVTVT
jgi:prepilin-type N-terminal cleavage/methylation domain-containing protein